MSVSANPAVRRAAVAGIFYPADADRCRATATEYLTAARATVAGQVESRAAGEVIRVAGGIVPHAGWICSGAIAAETIAAAAHLMPDADLIVVFGAIHMPVPMELGVLDDYSAWELPGGKSDVTTEVRRELASVREQFVVDDRFHDREHAVEVELPLIQLAWPKAAILPVQTPPNASAMELGEKVQRCAAAAGARAVYLASSDLTHYGPSYHFTPAGIGPAALEWAMQNDQRLLNRVLRMETEKIVAETSEHRNACGAGAIAAMLAACKAAGAGNATLLRHTSSYRTLAPVAPQPPINAVGYASVMVA
jgi:MEMO1 family protein